MSKCACGKERVCKRMKRVGYLRCNPGTHPFLWENCFIRLSSVCDLTNVCRHEAFRHDFTTVRTVTERDATISKCHSPRQDSDIKKIRTKKANKGFKIK